MKKLLMLILIALLVAFSIFLFIQGVHIGSFEIPGIKIIQENGVILHQIDFVRSPYNIPENIKAYRQLKD